MDIRNGKCFDCGAEYQIPASFPHDVARCKECGKAVHIAKVGEPMPTPPMPSAPPAPAKRVAPKVAAKPTLEEYRPSGKKSDGPSMLEKLKAQRAAAEGNARPKAEPRKPTAAKVAGLGSAAAGATIRPGAKAKQQATTSKTRTRTGASAGRPTARGGAARRGRKDEGDDAKRSERGRRGRPEKAKKGNPLVLVAILLLLGGAVAAFFFKDQLFGDASTAEASGPDVATNDDGAATDEIGSEAADATEDPMEAASGDAASGDAASGDAASGDAASGDDVGGDDAADASDPAADASGAAADEAAADEAAPDAPPDTGPDTTQLPDIGPILGTTDEQWTEMNELMGTWLDPYGGAASTRAGTALTEDFGVLAMPVMVNHLKDIDLSTQEGYDVAYQVKEKLKELVFGRNFGWKSINDPEYAEKGLPFNRKVVELWHAQVQRIAEEGIEYYIAFAKLEMKTSSDSDEYANPERAKLAAELRAKYGDGSTPAPNEDEIDVPDVEDDLEID